MSGSTSIMGQDYSADCQCYSNYHLFKAILLEPDISEDSQELDDDSGISKKWIPSMAKIKLVKTSFSVRLFRKLWEAELLRNRLKT